MSSRAFRNIDLKKASDVGSLGNLNVQQRFHDYLKRKVVYLKYEIRKERYIRLPLMDKYGNGGGLTAPYSISSVCGHISFLIIGASYLQTEFLNLRLYAVSGLTFAIIFQYFRERPLTVAIRWNFLLLGCLLYTSDAADD